MRLFIAYPYALEGYREALAQSLTAPDFDLVYADEHLKDDHVLRKIEEILEKCDLAVFDVTGPNFNVGLELGIAIAAHHPYIVVLNKQAVGTLAADIHGWDQLRYGSVEELGATLKERIARNRVPRRVAPIIPKRAKLWLYTERQATVSGGPYLITFCPTVRNVGDAPAEGFTVRLHYDQNLARPPHDSERQWTISGTYAVPVYEQHFDMKVFPGDTAAIPELQITTEQSFSTTNIGWSISCADGRLPEDETMFIPVTNARTPDDSDAKPYRPIG